MYGGHEFDIFGNSNITILSNDDDDQWESIRHADSTFTNPSTTNHDSQISSSPCWTNKITKTSRADHRHHYHSIETNAGKRKSHQDGQSAFGMVEKTNKRCCSAAAVAAAAAAASETNTNATSLDTNTHHSRPSVLRTHFFLHTTPSGAPVDLFKPRVDTSNCFCTQHTIYS
ncbi:hypothetical protein BCR42DRAFT_441354 [Absidia repens]|uniref:Uncharacterized protein n=1 Tax=Absidia repens TaxID=90262 RepID=A0A1X2I5E8_9FUNG|nr:hypothetical protein BCR42DRAFT_441354 [Absidia repens]